MSRTEAATGTLNRLSSDTFEGNVFDSLSATKRDVVLTASTDFTTDQSVEIGSAFVLEIPATTTLEILAYISQSDTNLYNKILRDTYMGDVFDNQSGTTENILLDGSKDFMVPESIELGAGVTFEIPYNSSMEILTYGSLQTANNTQLYFANGMFDYIESGCVWTADAAGSTLNGSMSAGYIWISGKRLVAAGIVAHAFTASKDTYVDFYDAGNGTVTVVYTEASNNAASPQLATGSLRNAIVVTGAGNIAAAGSINQGQESRVLPIASSIPYVTNDSLGNLICPRDPSRKLLAYLPLTSNQTSASGSLADITGLNTFCNIPPNRKVKASLLLPQTLNNTDTGGILISLNDVTAGAEIAGAQVFAAGANEGGSCLAEVIYTPAASGYRNFKGQFAILAGGTASTNGAATRPLWLKVELM